jgi:hypothetical protein
MFLKSRYRYIFVIIPLGIFYRPFLFFGSYQLIQDVGVVFLMNMFGGSYSRENIEIVLSFTSLFGILIMNILFGDYICKDYLVNGEYIFSREQNKGKWFLKKSVGLGAYCALGTVLYVGLYALGAVLKCQVNTTMSDIILFLTVAIVVWEFTYLSTLLINILALRLGISISFVITYSVIVVSEMITYCLQKMGDNKLTKLLHLLNPMSNMTISWNYSKGYISWAAVYFFILTAIVLILGTRVATKYEIGIKNSEV